MIRKASQFWIEDPLRKVNQPVLFITQAGSEADTTGKDGLGAMFVRNARAINSGDLPLFRYYAVNADGVKFTYTRIFDRESVLIEVPYKSIISVGKEVSRWRTVTKLRPAFEISDENGDIAGIVICDGDNWTESGKYYSINKDEVDPFEYGSWMCHYYSKPFDGDLIDKVIYTDNSITITDIAPCGYHNLVMPYTTVTNIGSFTYPEIYPDLDFVILTDLYDSGGFNSSYTGYVYFKDIINRNLSSVYTENFQIVASQNEPRQGISSKQTYYDEFGNLVIYYTIVGVVMESPPIYDIVYSSGLTNHYYVYDPVEYLIDWYDKYLLGSPRLSGVLDNNTWGMVYFDGLSWSYTTEDYFQLSNSSYKIKIVLCGKEFSSLYTFDVSIAGSTIDEYEIIIPQSPMSSNLRIYSVNGDIYLLSCLKDVSHVDSYYSGAITTTNPKCRYIIARYNDETSTSHTVEFDEIFDDDDSGYHEMNMSGGKCYGKFRLVKIEEKVEVEDV